MKPVLCNSQEVRILDNKGEFLCLLTECKNSLERLVYYKAGNRTDGDDILQEVYLAGYTRLDTLTDKTRFKSWIWGIARHKIADFYREKARRLELPLEDTISYEPSYSRMGVTVKETVTETLTALNDINKQILYLYYIKNKTQPEIAGILGIPLGTVKSRLYNAKQSFREKYPYPPYIKKGAVYMRNLPDIMPNVTIKKNDNPIFPVRWEECMGWFIIPRLGEKCTWAMYDYPNMKRSEIFELEVIGKAAVHGIEGVEIISKEYNSEPSEHKNDDTTRTFVVQLTDTHSRILLESHCIGGVKHTYTFYDEEFLKNWGFGEDNCGNEINLKPKGVISKDGSTITANEMNVLDVVGSYTVTLDGKPYDTVLVIDIECYNGGVMSESYLDKNGRTVLWRRYNKNDWKLGVYGKPWNERLPQNEVVTINGEIYVHWYDCITDYIV